MRHTGINTYEIWPYKFTYLRKKVSKCFLCVDITYQWNGLGAACKIRLSGILLEISTECLTIRQLNAVDSIIINLIFS